MTEHNNSAEIAQAFEEFTLFRAEFIAKWCACSVWKETREEGEADVRPLVLLRTQQQVQEFESDIATDQRLLAILAQDPDTFSPKATKFKPITPYYSGVTKVNLTQPPAINSRKQTSEQIIKRMKRFYDKVSNTHRALGTDESRANLERVTQELNNLKNDTEETYRIRTYGYTDTNVWLTGELIAATTIRIPLTGMFVLDLKESVQVNIADKIDATVLQKNYPIKPVPCSALPKGLLYRESEVQKNKYSQATTNKDVIA
ncbi:hypothetical protein KO527_05200 [Pseudoalteromonas sp. C2R02]|uniref:hypothetical protein n=1 Tax=Pseudoalteromonas sp. C2R02 TaxID=2841565 RepID=UPI001C081B37|nr:hypothetical protein [Pseudoalteromonas sp. C2R02]MBU2968744.1 hypothetical protein [Pseudoalteromonas sp. C2R02]